MCQIVMTWKNKKTPKELYVFENQYISSAEHDGYGTNEYLPMARVHSAKVCIPWMYTHCISIMLISGHYLYPWKHTFMHPNCYMGLDH